MSMIGTGIGRNAGRGERPWKCLGNQRVRESAIRADRREGAEVAEDNGANAAQRDYWNNVAGPRWVGLDGFVERRVAAVNDLLLRYSAVRAGETALEIGCGTGAFTVPLAAAVGKAGAVVGVDISAPMLAVAKRRFAEAGLDNVSVIEADAQTHQFEPGRFDLVASRFGVMFFADPAAAFANLHRATQRDGRLCFACWGALADNRHWLIPYEVVLRRLGPPASKPPHEPGPLAFSDPDYVRSFLRSAGFAEIAIQREHPEVVAATPAEEAEFACLMGPPARLIEEKQPDEATHRTIRREIEDALAAYLQTGKTTLPSTVLLVTAVKR
jgi:SAM-dependent methyltransferase